MNLLECNSCVNAKERILRASSRLFSEKGFDAARVNEIAEEAGVNKALIYYYFKSKEDILDTLLSSISNELESLSLDYMNDAIMKACDEGSLRIEHGGLSFSDEDALKLFMEKTNEYHSDLMDYMLERRELFRIVMLESLNRGRNNRSIMAIFNMANNCTSNPLCKDVYDAIKEHKGYADLGDIAAYYFFFIFIPTVNFVCYFSEYTNLLGKDATGLRKSFIKSLGSLLPLRVEGADFIRD